MRKREKAPSSAGNYYEIRVKKKTSTPQQDREGLVHHFRYLLKKRTPVFALHTLHQCIESRHFSHMRQETNRCEGREGLKRQ